MFLYRSPFTCLSGRRDTSKEGGITQHLGQDITKHLSLSIPRGRLVGFVSAPEDPNAWLLALMFGGFIAIPQPANSPELFPFLSGSRWPTGPSSTTWSRVVLFLFRDLSRALPARPPSSQVEVDFLGSMRLFGFARFAWG